MERCCNQYERETRVLQVEVGGVLEGTLKRDSSVFNSKYELDFLSFDWNYKKVSL